MECSGHTLGRDVKCVVSTSPDHRYLVVACVHGCRSKSVVLVVLPQDAKEALPPCKKPPCLCQSQSEEGSAFDGGHFGPRKGGDRDG